MCFGSLLCSFGWLRACVVIYLFVYLFVFVADVVASAATAATATTITIKTNVHERCMRACVSEGVGPDGQQVHRGVDRRAQASHPELVHGHERLPARCRQQQGDSVCFRPRGGHKGEEGRFYKYIHVPLRTHTQTHAQTVHTMRKAYTYTRYACTIHDSSVLFPPIDPFTRRRRSIGAQSLTNWKKNTLCTQWGSNGSGSSND